MRENRKHGARFFPPKYLVYFWINTRHNSKAQTFFFATNNFPAERLLQTLLVFHSVILRRDFPAKRLGFFFFNCGWPFQKRKLVMQSPRHDLFILSFISVSRLLESSTIFYSWIFLLHTILRSLKSKDIRKFIQKQYFRLYSELSLSLHHLLKSVSPAV